MPAIPVIVRPTGGVSVIVTSPLVGAPAALPTVTVYWTPICPRVKLPEWLLLIVGVGLVMIIVAESVALRDAEPPPETETWFTKGDVAFAAMLPVMVMVG